MTNGSEYMWYECGKAFYLRESELELEYHVFAHCSILCYAFQGMLIKLSEGMCTGMVVCLRLALAHVTYDTPSIRFHFFFLFLFSLLDHTLFLLQKSKHLFGYDLKQSDKKAGFQWKLYKVAMIVGPLIFFGLY